MSLEVLQHVITLDHYLYQIQYDSFILGKLIYKCRWYACVRVSFNLNVHGMHEQSKIR